MFSSVLVQILELAMYVTVATTTPTQHPRRHTNFPLCDPPTKEMNPRSTNTAHQSMERERKSIEKEFLVIFYAFFGWFVFFPSHFAFCVLRVFRFSQKPVWVCAYACVCVRRSCLASSTHTRTHAHTYHINCCCMCAPLRITRAVITTRTTQTPDQCVAFISKIFL